MIGCAAPRFVLHQHLGLCILMIVGVLELVAILHRIDDTAVVILATSLASAKKQKKTNQGDKTTNGDAHNGTNGQGSASRTGLGSNTFVGFPIGGGVLLGDGIGRLSELAIGTLVPGRALASGAIDTSNLVVDAPPLIDAEPVAGVGVITDDAKDLLGELAPTVIIVNVHAVAASILLQSRFLILPAGLVASPPTGAP